VLGDVVDILFIPLEIGCWHRIPPRV
jgi:hypothetical protein